MLCSPTTLRLIEIMEWDPFKQWAPLFQPIKELGGWTMNVIALRKSWGIPLTNGKPQKQFFLFQLNSLFNHYCRYLSLIEELIIKRENLCKMKSGSIEDERVYMRAWKKTNTLITRNQDARLTILHIIACFNWHPQVLKSCTYQNICTPQ